jgi:hypothetical protein
MTVKAFVELVDETKKKDLATDYSLLYNGRVSIV